MGIVKDLTGQRFGRLVVVSQVQPGSKGTSATWTCICDCGNTKVITRSYLCGKKPIKSSKSCGCTRTRLIDLTGQRFGKLTALEKFPNKGKLVTWRCLCDCGNYRIVESVRLRAKINPVISCRCTDKFTDKHGMSYTKLYRVWCSMVERCIKEENKSYYRYGGRGIEVCERWRTFSNFYEDMGEPPAGYTLERKDNNGNYEPSNCCWATYEEQASNKRNNTYFEYDNKRLTLAQWARLTGIPRYCLKNRLYYYGWSIEKALNTPVKSHKPYVKSHNK